MIFNLQNSQQNCCDFVTPGLFTPLSSRGLLEVRNLKFTDLSRKSILNSSLYAPCQAVCLRTAREALRDQIRDLNSEHRSKDSLHQQKSLTIRNWDGQALMRTPELVYSIFNRTVQGKFQSFWVELKLSSNENPTFTIQDQFTEALLVPAHSQVPFCFSLVSFPHQCWAFSGSPSISNTTGENSTATLYKYNSHICWQDWMQHRLDD